jgi:hypothetical protein
MLDEGSVSLWTPLVLAFTSFRCDYLIDEASVAEATQCLQQHMRRNGHQYEQVFSRYSSNAAGLTSANFCQLTLESLIAQRECAPAIIRSQYAKYLSLRSNLRTNGRRCDPRRMCPEFSFTPEMISSIPDLIVRESAMRDLEFSRQGLLIQTQLAVDAAQRAILNHETIAQLVFDSLMSTQQSAKGGVGRYCHREHFLLNYEVAWWLCQPSIIKLLTEPTQPTQSTHVVTPSSSSSSSFAAAATVVFASSLDRRTSSPRTSSVPSPTATARPQDLSSSPTLNAVPTLPQHSPFRDRLAAAVATQEVQCVVWLVRHGQRLDEVGGLGREIGRINRETER